MRLTGIAAAFTLILTAAYAQPPTLLAESFEGDPDGWRLQLNRGAGGSMGVVPGGVLGAQCLQVTPTVLHAPDDRQLPTNVHLRYETIPLKANTRYRLSVWMRADAVKMINIKVRRRDVEESVSSHPMKLTNSWRHYTFDFTLPEDYPDGTPQFLLGEDLTPVFIDAVTISEVSGAMLAPADYLRFNETISGPATSLVRFASNFDDEAHGWAMQLNRGAQAEMVRDPEAGCVRVTPNALCSPDDQPFETNIHLKYEGLSLKAGVEYVYSARLRAEAPRSVGLRIRRGNAGGSHGVATVEVGPQWQTVEAPFVLDEDYPAAVAQVLIGGETAAVWVDDVVIREADCGDEMPDDVICRGCMWLRPEVVTATGGEGPLAGLVELTSDLPQSFRLRLAVDMFGAEALRLALAGDDGAITVDVDENVVVRDAEGNELLREEVASEHWRPGEAVTVTLERIDEIALNRSRGYVGTSYRGAKLIIGGTHEIALDDASFERVLVGASGGGAISVLSVEGAEMLSLERPDGSTEKEEYTDPVTGHRIVRLTHSAYNDKHSYYDVSPWSPDGSLVFFTSALPNTNDATVYVMNADGTNIRKVGEGDSFSMHTGAFPQWGPDGRSVIYDSDEEGHCQVYQAFVE